MEASPEEENFGSMLIEKLTEAITDRDLNKFKHLVKNSSGEWWRKRNRFSNTLLLEAIQRNSKEIFDYILQFEDMLGLETVNISGKTALMLLLNGDERNQSKEYYACELINKGAHCDSSALHQAIVEYFVKVTKLLLEKGISVNLRDRSGYTALHRVLFQGPRDPRIDYEFVAALLYYGADPFIECYEGYNAFELSVLYNYNVDIQEILFYHTFDKSIRCNIHLDVLLKLATVKSPFFYQILEHDVKFVFSENFTDLLCDLFVVDVVCLRILLKKCKSVICKVIRGVNDDFKFVKSFREDVTEQWCESVETGHTLTNLSFLVDDDAILNRHFVNFIGNMNGAVLCDNVIYKTETNQANVTELLIYMFMYGLKCNSEAYDLVYGAYGYCELFKFLLHMDLQVLPYTRDNNNTMPAVIYDINLDLNKFFRNPYNFIFANDVRLLDYFAHPNLSNHFLNRPERWGLSTETLRKIENHPRIPSLLELSRNDFRKYFVKRLKIKSTKQFYCLLNGLQISTVYKKILTFETKLY